ncbi:AlpA family phage regulatory protein, partial [uncultured Acinetobacter sp.]
MELSKVNQQQFKILRLKEVTNLIGLSRSAIYDRINPKS